MLTRGRHVDNTRLTRPARYMYAVLVNEVGRHYYATATKAQPDNWGGGRRGERGSGWRETNSRYPAVPPSDVQPVAASTVLKRPMVL